MDNPKYKRVLLKISGEALAGKMHRGLDFDVLDTVAKAIKECNQMGVQIGIVVGGGNFWRGMKDGVLFLAPTFPHTAGEGVAAGVRRAAFVCRAARGFWFFEKARIRLPFRG